MKAGRRWLALDADFYANDFTVRLTNEFGLAGAAAWVGFLCACKRHQPPGRIAYASEPEGLNMLGIAGHDLINDRGIHWSLDDLWEFTGRMKQTKRTARGQLKNVQSTHWERWQDGERRMKERERQGRWRAQTRDKNATETRQGRDTNVTPDIDSDIDIPPTPQRGVARRFASNSQKPTSEPARPAIADWTPDPEPADPIDVPAALAAFRTQRGWTKPGTNT